MVRMVNSNPRNQKRYSETYALSLSGGDVVFNEAGEDVNFRVESDGNTGMLFVDGGNNRVGIGTNSPSVELEISGASEMLRLQSTDTNWHTSLLAALVRTGS